MARLGSGDSFDIGTWAQGDNPGAGSQDFTIFTDTGLNGNFKRLWRAVKNLLNPDGTVQNDKITGANLIPAGTVDNSTIEFSAGTGAKTLRVKDAGLTSVKYGAGSVNTAALAANAADNTIVKSDASVDGNRAITTNHIRDLNVTTPKINDLAITAAKVAVNTITAAKEAHDNNSRKVFLYLTQKVQTNGVFGWFGDNQCTSTLGIPMPRNGSVTNISLIGANGVAATMSPPPNFGTVTFSQNDFIGILYITAGGLISVTKNGSAVAVNMGVGAGSTPFFVTVEIELND